MQRECIILMGTKTRKVCLFLQQANKSIRLSLSMIRKYGSSNTNDLCSFVIKCREENVSILYPQSMTTLLVKDTYVRVHIKRTKKILISKIFPRSFNFIIYYLYEARNLKFLIDSLATNGGVSMKYSNYYERI